MRVAILSPHRDDAAFSCGLTMLALLRAGAHITILNIFTRSSYAVDTSSLDPALAPVEAISQARRLEDEQFVADLLVVAGCAPAFVQLADAGCLDAPLRLSVPTEEVLESPLTPVQMEQEASAVLAELGSLDEFDCIFAPVALGNHVDHCVVRDAAILGSGSGRLCLYEDLPYAARVSSEERKKQVDSAMESNGLQSFAKAALHMPHGRHLKKRFAMHYPSQIAETVADEMSEYAGGGSHGEGGVEHWWAPPAVTDSLAEFLRRTPSTSMRIEEIK